MARGFGILTAALAGTTLLLAGCGGSDDKPKATPPPSPPSSTVAAAATLSAEDQARDQILDAYKKYAAASDRVQHEGRAPAMGGDESTYMTDRARTEYVTTGLNMESRGTKITGDVVRSPRVTAIDLASAPAKATITACIDASAVKLVGANGQPVSAKPQAPRYVQTADLIRDGAAGQWRVDILTPDRQRSC